MSRFSQVAIGIVASLTSLGLLATARFTETSGQAVGMAGFGLFLGIVAIACLFRTGRAITMRITAAGVCLIGIGALISGFTSDDSAGRRGVAMWLAIVAGSGSYALFGTVPEGWIGDLFGKRPSPRTKRRNKRRPESTGSASASVTSESRPTKKHKVVRKKKRPANATDAE